MNLLKKINCCFCYILIDLSDLINLGGLFLYVVLPVTYLTCSFMNSRMSETFLKDTKVVNPVRTLSAAI